MVKHSEKSDCCHTNVKATNVAHSQKSFSGDELYICPMHPEVIRDAPGFCPICGMALEPKTISAENLINKELVDMTRRFWVGVIFSVPLLLLTMGMHIIGIHAVINFIPPHISSWIQLALATPVVLWCGWPLLQRGWISVIQRKLNMFTLIALGIGIAYLYSIFALLFPGFFPPEFRGTNGEVNLYFEAAAVITVLVLMGQVLELRGREVTGLALKALLNLAPKMTHKINPDGVEIEILVEQVQMNDLLRVHPGEKVPVDGKITEGHSTVDEAMVTGESILAEKEKDSRVIGGTLNVSGSFIMRAEHVGNETLLAQIVQQVSEAQRTRAPIQRLADMIASYFVPVVIVIAIITFFVWTFFGPNPAMTYGLISAISVLIIACPCALGLATPMSIIVGMGRGAQSGILIKDAESLECFEKVNTLLVDKTGTLTVGKPTVSVIIPAEGFTENDILLLAASLEQGSEHPLAGAIVNAAKVRGITLQNSTEFNAEIGKGIRGIINQKQVALGNIKLLELFNLQSGALTIKAEELRRQGQTVMFVIVDNKISGLISVYDPLKPTTLQAVKALRKDGIRIIMITGDNRTTAEAVAKILDITDIEAEILPQNKHAIVKNLRKKGQIVAMAGDGVNDAAALAEADIGIAMGTGTDIAMQSANITLVKGDLMGIVRARQLSKHVMRNIRQNLFLAFIYNLACIPIAAGVLYLFTGFLLNPMVGAAAMSLSSVSVIGNALRLRW